MNVEEFLKTNNLHQYWSVFDATGNDDFEELGTLNEDELKNILSNEICMKSGHVRKFINNFIIEKSGGMQRSQPNQINIGTIKMPKSVEALMIPNPQSDKYKHFNGTVEKLFDSSYSLMDINAFLSYCKSQRQLRWNLYSAFSEFDKIETLSLNSKDGHWINVRKFSQKLVLKKCEFNAAVNTVKFLKNHQEKLCSFQNTVNIHRNLLYSKNHNVTIWKANELSFYDEILNNISRVDTFLQDKVSKISNLIQNTTQVFKDWKLMKISGKSLKRKKQKNEKKTRKEKEKRLVKFAIDSLKEICISSTENAKMIQSGDFSFTVEMSNIKKNDSKLVHRFHYKGLIHLQNQNVFADYDGTNSFVDRCLETMNSNKLKTVESNRLKKCNKRKRINELSKTSKITAFFSSDLSTSKELEKPEMSNEVNVDVISSASDISSSDSSSSESDSESD